MIFEKQLFQHKIQIRILLYGSNIEYIMPLNDSIVKR